MKYPVADALIFRREVYLLTALLLADKKIGKTAALRDAALDYYDGEVGVRLIFIAASARQMLALDDSGEFASRICGAFSHTRMRPGERRPLDFHRACSAIIHAVEIWPYEVLPRKDDKSREFYDGTITVQSVGRRGGKTVAVVDGAIFAECCIILADRFVRKGES